MLNLWINPWLWDHFGGGIPASQRRIAAGAIPRQLALIYAKSLEMKKCILSGEAFLCKPGKMCKYHISFFFAVCVFLLRLRIVKCPCSSASLPAFDPSVGQWQFVLLLVVPRQACWSWHLSFPLSSGPLIYATLEQKQPQRTTSFRCLACINVILKTGYQSTQKNSKFVVKQNRHKPSMLQVSLVLLCSGAHFEQHLWRLMFMGGPTNTATPKSIQTRNWLPDFTAFVYLRSQFPNWRLKQDAAANTFCMTLNGFMYNAARCTERVETSWCLLFCKCQEFRWFYDDCGFCSKLVGRSFQCKLRGSSLRDAHLQGDPVFA